MKLKNALAEREREIEKQRQEEKNCTHNAEEKQPNRVKRNGIIVCNAL